MNISQKVKIVFDRGLVKECAYSQSCIHSVPLPRFEADKCVHDSGLMIFYHVLVHSGVVLPDVPLCGSVWNRPETERRRVCVRVLKLWWRKDGEEIRREEKQRGK